MEERVSKPNDELLVGGSVATVVAMAPPASQPPTPSDDADALPPPFSFSDHEGDDLEFEFPFVSRDSPAGTAAPADELFADGVIRPSSLFYPVFGGGRGVIGAARAGLEPQPEPAAAPAPRVVVRGQLGRLFLEESRSSSVSSSTATDDDDDDDVVGGLEGAPAPESYCLWTPGAGGSTSSFPSSLVRPHRPPRKSGSTGSMARWRRISELVVGRSHSDGKDKLMFFAAPTQTKEDAVKPKHKSKPSPANGREAHAEAHDKVPRRVAYVVPGAATPRRTFLPYREELVGFFANVNGVSRSHHHPN